MSENKTLQLAFLISMLLHFAIFLSAPYTGALPKKSPVKPIKVAYFKVKEQPKKVIGQKPEVGVPYVLPPKAPEALPEVKKEDIVNPPPASTKDQVKKEEPIVETISSNSRAVIGAKGRKFETVVNDEKDKGRKATYIGYYRAVREKIRYYADRNYLKEGSASQGEVFLSFVVAASGELLHIMIIDAKSIEDPLLRNIAIDSIRDASPFPTFPQGMNQYQVTFNVVISFELNK
ncbi:MAG: hypothetical protein KKB22_08085 [Candidatus Omnitrophica bacterium]|nr:hypothetical protein [Candidatus Omnitrophota bacterium]